LARKGVNVVIRSRTEDQINSVVKEIEKKKLNGQGSALGIKCDVSISSQVNSLIKSTIEKFGSDSIDILVNNAEVVFRKKLIDTSEEEWDKAL
jgi:3-oxoacyl-[acyl-carrier protein] reductase